MKRLHLSVLQGLHIAKIGIAAGAGLLSGYLILLLTAFLLFGFARLRLTSSVLKLSIFLVLCQVEIDG